MNHLPAVRDDSEGFWRRTRVIPFNHQFGSDERDPQLEAKLEAELPGVLAWMVQEAVMWFEGGLAAPKSVMLATHSYRDESDPLAAFFDEACHVGPELTVRARGLYTAYAAWAERSGVPLRERLSAQLFGRRVGERFASERDRDGKSYCGVGLRSGTGDGYIRHPAELSQSLSHEQPSEKATTNRHNGPEPSPACARCDSPKGYGTLPGIGWLCQPCLDSTPVRLVDTPVGDSP